MKILFIIGIILSATSLFAQNNLESIEYWFDSDISAKVSLDITESSSSYVADLAIETSGIDIGLHLFNYRILDNNNNWSRVHSQFFVKKQHKQFENPLIVNYEYWIDDNYAGKAYVELETPVNPYELISQVETPVLPIGDHLFSIRFQDSNGTWSETQSASFVVNSCYLTKATMPTGDVISCISETENEYKTRSVEKASNYIWSILPENAGIIIASDTSAIISWDDSYVGEVQIWLAAANECGSGENSDTLHVERIANPEKPSIADAGFYDICDGDSIVFTASDGFTYSWQDLSDNQSFTAKYSGSYFVSIMNDAGCSAYSDTITVEAHKTPNAPSIMAYGDTEFCAGDSVEIGMNNMLKGNTYHLWSTGETTGTIWVKESGAFAHKLISEYACESDFSDTLTITVYENPVKPSISRLENTLTSSEAYTYQWYKDLAPVAGLVAIDNAIEQSFSPAESGIYAVEVSNENGCSDFSDVLEVMLTGIEIQKQKDISVYPNPNSGSFVLSLPQEYVESQIVISDLSGKIVVSEEITGFTHRFSLSLNPGVYFLNIKSKEQVNTIQFHIY